jgi:beta-glucosidase
VIAGRVRPEGKLPFQLPRDGASVERSRPDVVADLEDPLFDRGYGGV